MPHSPVWPGNWSQLNDILTRLDGVVVNVKNDQFAGGAVGDGVKDDTAAIQAAMDACNAAGGGIVYLPPGTYRITGTAAVCLVIRTNVTLLGAGKEATTIKLANTQNANMIYTGNGLGASNVTVADMTLDGNSANQTAAGSTACFRAASTSKINLLRLRIVNGYDSSVYMNTCTDVLVHACSIEANGPGANTGNIASLRFDSTCSRVRITNNFVDTPRVHGIGFGSTSSAFVCTGNIVRNPVSSTAIGIAGAGGTDCIIADNWVTSALTDGNCIDIGDAVNYTIRGNVCVGGRTGIDWDSGTNVNRGNRNTIVGNVCHGCALIGIAAGGTNNTGNGQDASIVGNVVSGCAIGISVDGILNGVIANNIVKNPTSANPGIKILSSLKTSSGFVITGNRCYDDQGSPFQTYGIQSVGSCDFLTVSGNDVRGNVTGGISLVGSNNLVGENLGFKTRAVKALSYSSSIATDASFGDVFPIVATNGTAFTIQSPTNLQTDMVLTYDIKNSSGGAHGVITWGATFLNGGAGTVGTGAFAGIANGKRRTISFYYDGTNLVELSRTADI